MFKIAFCGGSKGLVGTHYLFEFLSATERGSHAETCKRFKAKLDQLCQQDVVKLNGGMMYADKLVRPLFVKEHIEPDVFVNLNDAGGATYFQCEVHSAKQSSLIYNDEDYRCTIRKLCAGLAEQLRGLRQRKPDILMLSGLYLSTLQFPGRAVEEVTCTWDEEYLCFAFVCKPYRNNRTLLTDIGHILQVQRNYFDLPSPDPVSKPFVIPLTCGYLQSNFTPGAVQLRSGESIVIQSNSYVYKAPFLEVHRSRLLNILLSGLQSENSRLPLEMKAVFNVTYFVFSRCRYKPLPLVKLRQLYRSDESFRSFFLKRILDAIQELHSLHIAHLDIRVDNICFNASGQPVLIDLDRSLSTTSSLEIIQCDISKYGQTPMYTIAIEEGEGAESILLRLDFKQLAIMILHIENLTSKDYYTDPADNIADPFLPSLYDGNFNNALFQSFL